MFFAIASWPSLTVDQAQELDDEFFESRPLEYFQARIASLIRSSETSDDLASPLARAFSATLGVDDLRTVLGFSPASRELQVAIDSFALRHHAAEALVRLYHALTVDAQQRGQAPSVWARIADGPYRIIDLVEQSRSHLSGAGHHSFWTLVLRPTDIAELGHDKLTTGLNVLGSWLKYAMQLLVRDDIDINATHNKVKHGLAVKASYDLATLTLAPFQRGGPVSMSALTGPSAFDIFAGPTLDYLARPHKIKGRAQGLEITTLKLRPATLLIEAWMIATTYGAMFHLAAARHFSGRDVEIAPIPAFAPWTDAQRAFAGLHGGGIETTFDNSTGWRRARSNDHHLIPKGVPGASHRPCRQVVGHCH